MLVNYLVDMLMEYAEQGSGGIVLVVHNWKQEEAEMNCVRVRSFRGGV